MKSKILLITTLLSANFLMAQQPTDEAQIITTLNNYINGSSYNDTDKLNSAFADDATLYLTLKDGSKRLSPNEYAGFFKNKEKGVFNGRIGNILSINRDNDIATANVEIVIPKANIIFTDLFLLKNIENQWKIISKTATKKQQPNKGRILFITSNSKFYADTKLKTGTSFSEIVDAYDTFIKAGYYVDFVSPNGGSIAVAYYDESDLQKQYFEDDIFMNRLKHTKSPTEINPESYNAVYYVGGGAAMFGVPENEDIQNIAMAVYEKQNGVISAVCHGTAGIVNLKNSNGDYLVKGKKVTGYPEAYENTESVQFKTFPFLIGKTIENHGGDFSYGKRRTEFYQVDDRLITGQSNLASKVVAEKVIETIEKSK